MAISFPTLPTWLWRNPAPQPPSSTPDSPPSPPPLDFDTLPYHPPRRNAFLQKSRTPDTSHSASFPSGAKRHDGRRRWHKSRRQAPNLDPDFDMVLVPPDAGCYLSSSDSEDSDWSVGWFEPHAPDFCSDSEPENSFAVLVRCYGSPSLDNLGGWGRAREDNSQSQLWSAVLANIAMNSQADSQNCLQQLVSSLQG